MIQRALDIRAGGRVTRWHTLPILGQQTVAEHTFHVLTLLSQLHANPSTALIQALLFHDVPEFQTGDLPHAPFTDAALDEALARVERQVAQRLALPVYGNLVDMDQRWFRFLDSLECVFFCLDQATFGHRMPTVFQYSMGKCDTIAADGLRDQAVVIEDFLYQLRVKGCDAGLCPYPHA